MRYLDPIITGARAGDARAQRNLYENHFERVYRLTLRMTGDPELAGEFTQQAFTRAFRWLDTFRGESCFATWLHRLAVNVTLSGLSQVRRRQDLERNLDQVGPLPAYGCDRDPILQRRIRTALDSLPEIYRMVVVMHDLEGFTHDEIGTIMEIPSGTSKARLSRARRLLRPLLRGCALEYAAR